MYVDMLANGEFPKPDNLKLMFLQAPPLKIESNQSWMRKVDNVEEGSNRPKRNVTDRERAADAIANIVMDEIASTYAGVENAREHVFLAGKSQGGMLAMYVQLMKLDEPIGGVASFSGSLLHPLMKLMKEDIEEARATATCLDPNMRFFFWHGDNDRIFDARKTYENVNRLFMKLGILTTIEDQHIEEHLGHVVSTEGLESLIEFINDDSHTDSMRSFDHLHV